MTNRKFKLEIKASLISSTEKKWLVIQTQRYKEKRLYDILNKMNIDFFLPRENKKERHEADNIFPIIPMTIFVNINQTELLKILKDVSFCRYMKIPNQDAPLILSDHLIKKIKSSNLHLKKIIQIINYLIAMYERNEKTSKCITQ